MKEKLDSLAARLRSGNRPAAEEFVTLYFGNVYKLLRRLGHSHHISEELTQETFVTAWQKIGQLRDGRALDTWLYRITVNCSREFWRRSKKNGGVEIELIEDRLAAPEQGSDAEEKEMMAVIRKDVSKLPVKLREVVVLHYLQDLSISSTAEILDVTKGTVKGRIGRALTKLRCDK